MAKTLPELDKLRNLILDQIRLEQLRARDEQREINLIKITRLSSRLVETDHASEIDRRYWERFDAP